MAKVFDLSFLCTSLSYLSHYWNSFPRSFHIPPLPINRILPFDILGPFFSSFEFFFIVSFYYRIHLNFIRDFIIECCQLIFIFLQMFRKQIHAINIYLVKYILFIVFHENKLLRFFKNFFLISLLEKSEKLERDYFALL